LGDQGQHCPTSVPRGGLPPRRAEAREPHWAEEFDGERPIGCFVELSRHTDRKHQLSFKLVSLRMLASFVRAAEDVTIVYELGLVGLDAGLSRLIRRRGLISLVEGDYPHLGRTGTADAKVAVRRLAARSVGLFIAHDLRERRDAPRGSAV
jgi:hypothetical protein